VDANPVPVRPGFDAQLDDADLGCGKAGCSRWIEGHHDYSVSLRASM
jgi:hypothetical protein